MFTLLPLYLKPCQCSCGGNAANMYFCVFTWTVPFAFPSFLINCMFVFQIYDEGVDAFSWLWFFQHFHKATGVFLPEASSAFKLHIAKKVTTHTCAVIWVWKSHALFASWRKCHPRWSFQSAFAPLMLFPCFKKMFLRFYLLIQ